MTPTKRQQVKTYLIIANIALGTILAIMLGWTFLVIQPNEIRYATIHQRYMYFDLNNLPEFKNTTELDYLGVHKTQNIKDPTLTMSNKKAIKPKIAMIITNLGLSRLPTELAINTPKEFGLGFLPYTSSLKSLLYKAQENGHEIYLYLPLEMESSSDNPGKHALMINQSLEENISRLEILLNSFKKYEGVYSSYREKVSSNSELMNAIFEKIKHKNLIFILGKNNNTSTLHYSQNKVGVISANIVIDKELDREKILHNLELLVTAAKENSSALGYIQGYALTIEIINEWLPTLKKNNIELVPASELMKEPGS